MQRRSDSNSRVQPALRCAGCHAQPATPRGAAPAGAMRFRRRVSGGAAAATAFALVCMLASSAQAGNVSPRRERDIDYRQAAVVGGRSGQDAHAGLSTRATVGNLLANGGFSEQPNPLAFWTNAPGAFATWLSDGANSGPGAVHLRFLPPISPGVPTRGAIYYTGLSQCVAIPGPGRYLLRGFARVPESASPSSLAGIGWKRRSEGPNCSGPVTSSGRVNIVRSTAWTASAVQTIEVHASGWTPGDMFEIEVQVGDSSTISIEPVEAVVDDITLVEGPLFADGFEE